MLYEYLYASKRCQYFCFQHKTHKSKITREKNTNMFKLFDTY